MTTKEYKKYSIIIIGLSHHIFRPGKFDRKTEDVSKMYMKISDGYAQSMKEAKRWINSDIKERLLDQSRYYA